MDLITEIRNHFVAIGNNVAIPLSLPADFQAWVIHTGTKIGVAIPCKLRDDFYEYFASVQIEYLPNAGFKGVVKELLFLYVDNNEVPVRELSFNFAAICSDFVSPGDNGKNRKDIVKSPVRWWKKWKELVGNSNSEKTVHGLVGELYFYYWLLRQGKDPQWTGCKYQKIDFICSGDNYEVKSTISPYSNEVIVHGQFQLLLEGNKPLNLIFCRFEERKDGESIDSLLDKLCKFGVKRSVLENDVGKLGYKKGLYDRKRRFKLLEMKQYQVDGKFPRIVANSFKNNKLPLGIIRVQYSIDLSNLPFKLLK